MQKSVAAPHLHASVPVVIFNDQATPYGFVTELLVNVFSMRRPEAQKFAYDTHWHGEATIGWFPRPIAEAFVAEAKMRISKDGHSLRIGVRDAEAEGSCDLCGEPSDRQLSLGKKSVCESCLMGVVQTAQRQVATRSFTHTNELLNWHFAGVPKDRIVTSSRIFPAYMRADLQLAAQALFGANAIRGVGIGGHHRYEPLTFAALLQAGNQAKTIAPVEYEQVDTGEDDPVPCPANIVWLLEDAGMRMAVLSVRNHSYNEKSSIRVEIAVPAGEAGSQFVDAKFRALAAAVAAAQSYRGKVISLESGEDHSGKSSGIMVHRLPKVKRSEVILPKETLALLERNVIDFAKQRSKLKALGLSAKKGILFYGPPGTGKTHTIRYLAGALPDHTTLLITAEQAGLIGEYFKLARLLQPSLMIIEDADLIARAREDMGSACEEVLLNKMLNEMDGLKEDADIFFILTTNRPQQLEGALAGRPGRIDQAIEVPLPDKVGRAKLIKLYARGLLLEKETIAEIVQRTEGVSGAFIKELMRRAAQAGVERETAGPVTSDDIDGALQDMLFRGGRLNASLLGAADAKFGQP
jgi:AAA+ superfamily predicted ATPase/ATP-dependent Clp protease adapter protein ClpS